MGNPTYCRHCGTKFAGDVKFCTTCGASIADASTPPQANAAAASNPNELIWRVEVPLLTNRFIVGDTLLGGAITVLVSGTLIGGAFGWSGGWAGVRSGFIFAGVFGLFYLVIAVLTLGVIFGNRWPLEFAVSEDGVIQNNVSEKAHAIHRLSWILAILTGRPLMAGPGLIAQSREIVGIAWEEVRTVRKYPALGVIGIRGGLLDNIRLYCTPANFADVAQRVEAAVKQHAPSARIT